MLKMDVISLTDRFCEFKCLLFHNLRAFTRHPPNQFDVYTLLQVTSYSGTNIKSEAQEIIPSILKGYIGIGFSNSSVGIGEFYGNHKKSPFIYNSYSKKTEISN